MKLKFLTLICIITLLTIPTFAQSYGIIGSVLTTDIRAYINGSEIPAYNVNGNMVIVGSDLRNYGFDVVYDNNTRTSNVSYSGNGTWNPLSVASGNDYSIGEKVMDVYDTDITVLLNGMPVTSYNVDGRMAFKFSELKIYGDYYYDNGTRTTNLWIDSDVEFPMVSQNTGANNSYNHNGIITVSSTYLKIFDKTTITINSNHEDYPDGIALNAEYDSSMIDVEWGDWIGWLTTLDITPVRAGTTTIKITSDENPDVNVTIEVEIANQELTLANDTILQRMAALGIDTAYNSAKYPSTLHLNIVTYEDMVNGYGDLITRMVLRCYATNSFGGYGDIYVVVTCCDHETTYINDEWDGYYYSTAAYNSEPGMCDNILNNDVAMNAYKTYIRNPKEIPYD